MAGCELTGHEDSHEMPSSKTVLSLKQSEVIVDIGLEDRFTVVQIPA